MSIRPLHVTVLNWRDTTHPEGGGSEVFLERIAAELVADGCRVDILCSAHGATSGLQTRNGIHFHHAGGRFGVYPQAIRQLLGQWLRGQKPDVVIDVHNGVPFWARFFSPSPVIVLVHHVHREQWGVVFSGLVAKFGWFLESQVSPRLHRGCQYVAVSDITRQELASLGVRRSDIAVVHNGSEPIDERPAPRSEHPQLVVLGRVVPHKRIEHAIDVVAALSDEFPTLRLAVAGDGWWSEKLIEHARAAGVLDRVDFHGFISEEEKSVLLSRSWLMLAPSVKEGWGLVVMEAAVHEVPSVAYNNAGGLSESIRDGETGVLVGSFAQMVDECRRLLHNHEDRQQLGKNASDNAMLYSWRTASTSLLQLVHRAARGEGPTDSTDPTWEATHAGLRREELLGQIRDSRRRRRRTSPIRATIASPATTASPSSDKSDAMTP